MLQCNNVPAYGHHSRFTCWHTSDGLYDGSNRKRIFTLTSPNFCISTTLILKPGNNNLCDLPQLSKLFVELEAKDLWYMAKLVAKYGHHSRHVLRCNWTMCPNMDAILDTCYDAIGQCARIWPHSDGMYEGSNVQTERECSLLPLIAFATHQLWSWTLTWQTSWSQLSKLYVRLEADAVIYGKACR